jgi:hypothetical protein
LVEKEKAISHAAILGRRFEEVLIFMMLILLLHQIALQSLFCLGKLGD